MTTESLILDISSIVNFFFVEIVDLLYDFNCMSTSLGLFYSQGIGFQVDCTFIFTYFLDNSWDFFSLAYCIRIVLTYILIHSWESNRYYHPRLVMSSKAILSTPLKWRLLIRCTRVKHRTPLCFWDVFLLTRGYTQHFISLVDKVSYINTTACLLQNCGTGQYFKFNKHLILAPVIDD